MRRIFWLFIPLLLTSCFEEDEAVLPHEPGDVETAMIAMTKNYANHVFFDLGPEKDVLTAGKLNWDLGFEPGPAGWRIYLNTTRFMQAALSGNPAFESVKDTSGLVWNFDTSSGNPDSTAFGPWYTVIGQDTVPKQLVYVLDLGFDAMGNMLGFRKLQITGWSRTSYTIRYARLDGSDEMTATIPKESDRDIICYSLRNHKIESDVRPASSQWDLWFTQYTTLLYTLDGTPYPYLVTGVLTNRFAGAAAVRVQGHTFAEINYDIAQGLTFEDKADAIGYDWKYYDFNAASYSVDPELTYVVRTVDGELFKLRFIGFYNNLGEKGYPTIEYQRL